MVDHGTRSAIYHVAYESCFTMVFFLWPWTKVNHGPQGPWLTMVPRVAIYRGMKHGRPWIIHGHFVVNHVFKTWSTLFKTWSTLFKTWSTMFWPRSFHRGSMQSIRFYIIILHCMYFSEKETYTLIKNKYPRPHSLIIFEISAQHFYYVTPFSH